MQGLSAAVLKAPAVPVGQMLDRITRDGLRALGDISTKAVQDFNSLTTTSAGDLRTASLIDEQNEYPAEEAVEILSRMVGSPDGIRQLAIVSRLLLYFSGASEESCRKATKQLIAWMKKGEEVKAKDKLARFESKLSVLPSSALRLMRTPVKNWGEVSKYISSGGGMEYLGQVFENTPVQKVLECVSSSLVCSLELQEIATGLQRSIDDLMRSTTSLSKTVVKRSKMYQEHLNAFEKAKENFVNLQTRLDQLEGLDSLSELEKVAVESAKALIELQKYNKKVALEPTLIEESRIGLSSALNIVSSMQINIERIQILSVQYRQNAMLRVYQIVMALSTLASQYSEAVMAQNRALQLDIINDCRKKLELVTQGEFEELEMAV